MIDYPLTAWLVVLNVMQFAAFCVFSRFDRGVLLTLAVPLALAGLRALATFFVPGFDQIEVRNLPLLFFPYCAVYFSIAYFFSRDVPGRRLFLMFVYALYEIPYAVFAWAFYHDYASRFGPWTVAVINSALLIGIHLIWMCVIVPQTRRLPAQTNWKGPVVVVALLTVVEHAAGVWPQSLMGCTTATLAAFLVLVSVITGVFPVLMRYVRVCTDNARLRDLEDSMRLITQEMRGRQELLAEARRIRHDKRHHVSVMRELLDNGDIPALQNYLAEMNAETYERLGALPMNDRWCPNELVNAILSGAARYALKRKIDFRTDLRILPELPIPETDFVPLLANLLENALKAVEKVGEGAYVALRLIDDSGTLRLRVANPVPPGLKLVRGLPTDTPGVGLQSVQLVVEKFAGFMDFVLEEGVLTCRVVLNSEKRT